MAIVFTMGIESEEIKYVKERFARESGAVYDVSDQYQDILATACDIVIVIEEKASKEALAAIDCFRKEVGDEDDTQYYIMKQKDWDEILLQEKV